MTIWKSQGPQAEHIALIKSFLVLINYTSERDVLQFVTELCLNIRRVY